MGDERGARDDGVKGKVLVVAAAVVVEVVVAAAVVVEVVVAAAVVVEVVDGTACGADRPQPPANAAGASPASPMRVARRLLCTVAIFAGLGPPPRDAPAPGPGMASRYGAPTRGADIFATVVTLYAVVATSGAGSDGLFYALLVLHVAAALTGFGSIGLAGTYAGRAAQLTAPAGPEGPVAAGPGALGSPPAMTGEELARYFRRPAGLWWALLAVPWLGLGALVSEPHGGGAGQAWALGAFGVWVGAALVAAVLVVPALRRIGAALAPATSATGSRLADDATRAGVARSGRLASRGAAVCDVLFFLALALMIWQP